ncbi:uncharacterized protein TNCV_4507541 [Trichonephila clavipes]|nr:uncharacterized protein TNCV_4507541 [Trichonephila clavipes]
MLSKKVKFQSHNACVECVVPSELMLKAYKKRAVAEPVENGAFVQRNSSTVSRVWKQWTDEHRTTKKTGSRQLKVTSARNNRHLLRLAVNDRTASSRQLNARLSTGTGVLICQVIYSQFGLAIHQNDHQARRRFVEWAQNEIAFVPDFHKRILFSDEAHFWSNGYVNKHNCRIWSEANPQVYVETPLHPEKLTVWCALWAGGILLQKR